MRRANMRRRCKPPDRLPGPGSRRAAFAGTPAGPGVLRRMKLKQNSREGVEHETAERFLRRRPAGDGVAGERDEPARRDRKSDGEGKTLPVRIDRRGRRILNKKT